jgi:hypothetical protein
MNRKYEIIHNILKRRIGTDCSRIIVYDVYCDDLERWMNRKRLRYLWLINMFDYEDDGRVSIKRHEWRPVSPLKKSNIKLLWKYPRNENQQAYYDELKREISSSEHLDYQMERFFRNDYIDEPKKNCSWSYKRGASWLYNNCRCSYCIYTNCQCARCILIRKEIIGDKGGVEQLPP